MGVVLTILAILVILIIACNWNSKPVQEEEAEALKKRQLVENCIAIAASNGFTVSRKIEAGRIFAEEKIPSRNITKAAPDGAAFILSTQQPERFSSLRCDQSLRPAPLRFLIQAFFYLK